MSDSSDNARSPDAGTILVRLEHWSTASDRSVFRRTLAQAIHVNASTLQPITLPSFNGARHILHVRALTGNILIEVGYEDDAAKYSPIERGHLLLEGESARFLIHPENYIMIEECNHPALSLMSRDVTQSGERVRSDKDENNSLRGIL
ncbi:hypothetical protein [Mesorhizobium sp. M0977]|uniref:hypothetical protein n=1 Tax=Mesorhizobium sp. M0977 TaxID=2957039 RepID=UPI00333C18A7